MFIQKRNKSQGVITTKKKISVVQDDSVEFNAGEENEEDDKQRAVREVYFNDEDSDANSQLKRKRQGVGASKLSREQIKNQMGDDGPSVVNAEKKALRYKILEQHSHKKRQKRGRGPTIDYGTSDEDDANNDEDDNDKDDNIDSKQKQTENDKESNQNVAKKARTNMISIKKIQEQEPTPKSKIAQKTRRKISII